MAIFRLKGYQIFKDRHGRQRCYHRATRTAIDLEKNPIGSAGFLAECARIDALAKAGIAANPGTLGLLITKYRKHTAFTELAPRTRADYQKVFDYLQPISREKITRFKSPFIVKLRDKAFEKHGRWFANYTITVLRLLFTWGKERGFVETNPAMGIRAIKRSKGMADANRPWTDDERNIVLETVPAHMKLPIALMMFTGLDPQDAMKLKKSAIKEGMIDTARGKTKVAVWMPLPEPLLEVLNVSPKHDAITLCASSRGVPWTISGFRASWRKVKLKLEADGSIGAGLTLKGLRHTVATILAEIGKTPDEIANVLGQKTPDMARHYSKHANRTEINTKTVADFTQELDRRRTNSVKPN